MKFTLEKYRGRHFEQSATVGWIRNFAELKRWELLTLGAHAQRGLLYLVCVSVCGSEHM